MSRQKYTYTYDNALEMYFVRDIETDSRVFYCRSELSAVIYIQQLLTDSTDFNLISNTNSIMEQ